MPRNENEPMAKQIKIKRGTIVTSLRFVPGYPVGLSSDTRCVVREILNRRVRVERDDGREGSWWIDVTGVRTQPASNTAATKRERTMITATHKLCTDCMMVAVNDDATAIDADERVAEVYAGIDALGWVSPNFDTATGEGYSDHSIDPCGCCRTQLHGERFRFVKLG